MKLSICIHQFFGRYLPHILGVSKNTIKTYRDSFTLFLPFAAKYHSIKIESLKLDHLSWDLILAFLDDLERQRKNVAKTRNNRLAALKSFAKMTRLMYPEKKELAEKIIDIPQKRTQKPLIGFLYPDEILKTLQSVDLKKSDGFRDYTILHLLNDSGSRASELATLNIDYLNPLKKTLVILGKGNRARLIELWPKTIQLIELYISEYRTTPKPLYQHRIFINQRGEELTRHGIYRLCKKYLSTVLDPKRMKEINPVHSFRHACAMRILHKYKDLSKIQIRLGHENIETSTLYTHLDINYKRELQKQFDEYTQSVLTHDPKIEELIDWENKEDIMDWLDSL